MIISQSRHSAISNDKQKQKNKKHSKASKEPTGRKLRRYSSALTEFVPDASPERILNLGRVIECFMYYQVRHLNNPDAIAYPEAKLRDKLGRNWKQWAGHIVFTEGGYRFSKARSYTRELTVRQDVVKSMRDSWRNLNEEAAAPNKLGKGQLKAMLHGRTPEQYRVKTNLPSTVTVDTYNIRLLETVYGDWLDAIDSASMPEFCAEQYIELYEDMRSRSVHAGKSFDEFAPVWYRAISARMFECQTMREKLQGDQLPQHYQQRRNKPRYQLEGIGLQNCTKWLRYAALSGQWSYDIKACHHFIMQHYARLGGISCPTLDRLVSDKSGFREELNKQTGLSIDCIKTALLIKSYGGRFCWSDVYDDDKENALRELLGIDGQKVLADNEIFKSLSAETHQITTFIIEHHKPQNGARGGYLNAMGQLLRSVKGATLKRSQIAAFIMQGIETRAAMAIIDASTAAQVLIHDGIVCAERENITALESAMFDATGIKFELDEDQIKAPDWL